MSVGSSTTSTPTLPSAVRVLATQERQQIAKFAILVSVDMRIAKEGRSGKGRIRAWH